MMTMATDSPLRSPERTPDQPFQGRTGLSAAPYHEYMELELRSVEVKGAHEAGGVPSTIVARVWAPFY